MALSWITVEPGRETALREAFDERLGAVDAWDGFLGLELLADRKHAGRYLMVSRWRSKDVFITYMRSEDHARSHARIPDGPRPAGFDEFDVVAS